MTATETPRAALASLTARGAGVELLLDQGTGLPAGIAAARAVVPLRLGIELESGGEEVPGTMGGLVYRNTDRSEVTAPVPGVVDHVTAGPEEYHVREAEAGEWRVRWTVRFRAVHPRVELRVAVTPAGQEERVLRDLHLTVDLPHGGGDRRVEAPGNMLRPGVRAADLREPVGVLSAGDQLGSPGFVAIYEDEEPFTLILWPLSRSESGEITLEPTETGLRWHLRTELGGAVGPGEWLEHGPTYLDLVERPWDRVRGEIRGWYGSVGIATPTDQPAWAGAANIFEVMVGAAPFHGGREYRPYPTLPDLIADLDRIAELGCDCLQLMPRHPYPSYNIHAPGDVRTTYGEPEQVRELVAASHARGIRVVLDILLHGVVDRTSIRRAIEVVRDGPHASALDDPCADPYTVASTEISWCRHILAFASYWIEHSPDRHALLDEHPDWFMRDSSGEVTGVYTNALDIANREWQEHFVDGCEALVGDYGFDGFRLDAPLYNRHANWSEATRRHASHSNLGSLRLLRELRRRLRAISPDLLVYSEPSGPLVRESLDLGYAYEENWLIPSLFPREGEPDRDWRRVRTGRELAEWLRDLHAAQPAGSVSAHFIDAHDTMWWRLPGDWWRREQIGLDATRAMLAIHSLRGGAYMTFVGGEREIEAELRHANKLRTVVPEIRAGAVSFDAVSVDDDAVYAVLRHLADRAAVVAVNVSAARVRTACAVEPGPWVAGDPSRIFDAWSGEWLPAPAAADGVLRLDLTFAPYQPRVLLLAGPLAQPSASRCSTAVTPS